MALDFPWQMFLEAQQQKNQNQRNMMGDIAGIGQGFGQTAGAVGDAIKQQRIKSVIDNMLKQNSGGQQQGPAPMAGVGGAGPGMPAPQQAPDPVLSTILPFLKADPSMAKEMLPAMVKGEYLQHRQPKGGMTDYQSAALSQRDRQFQERMKFMQGNEAFKQQILQMAAELRKKGLNLQAKKLEDSVLSWQGNNVIKTLMGYGPQLDSNTMPEGGGGDSGGGDDGWGPVQVSQ